MNGERCTVDSFTVAAIANNDGVQALALANWVLAAMAVTKVA